MLGLGAPLCWVSRLRLRSRWLGIHTLIGKMGVSRLQSSGPGARPDCFDRPVTVAGPLNTVVWGDHHRSNQRNGPS